MSKCQPVHNIVAEIWRAYGPALTKAGIIIGTAAGQPAAMAAAVAAAGKAAEIGDDLVKFWNSNVAGNSWAKIGPRRLDFGTMHEGKVVSATGRYFICPTPSTHDKIRIEFWEKGGKAKTEVSFHLMNPATGGCRDVGNYVFNENNDEKKNTRQHIDRTISDAIGLVPVVHIDGDSFANSLEYALRLSAA